MSVDFSVVGVEAVDYPCFNLNNGNAAALLGALGLPDHYLVGRCTIPEARRAIIHARNVSLARFTRPPSSSEQPGRARYIQRGLDAEALSDRVAMFEALIKTAEQLQAAFICWG